MGSSAKSQRWVDLLAALLQHTPVTFEEIARVVPAYSVDPKQSDAQRKKEKDAVKRMFERDKKELILGGVPIETIGESGSPDVAYRVKTLNFYLPYMAMVTARGKTTPRRVDRYGYRLPELTFDAEELRAIAEGAARARNLGSEPLVADIDVAMRKLGYDLPMDSVSPHGDVRILKPRARAHGKILLLLGDALRERRRVRFEYQALGAEAPSKREVEPYGLFFLNGHWYLAARDATKDAVRNFRVNRIRNAKASSADKELADYYIPPDFHLRDHARSRQAWELGDADEIDAVVEFRNGADATFGEKDASGPGRRRFRVRRSDAFIRWLLSFAGSASPVSPPTIVAEFMRQVAETRALYAAPVDR